MEAQIENDLLKASARDESRYCIGIHDLAFQRKSSGYTDQVGFADALHEVALWHFGLKLLKRSYAQIGANEKDSVVFLS
jgi:hypothetical protein